MSAPSPARVLELLRKEFRQMFRDPRMKGVVFVSPIIQLLVFGYAVNTDVRNTRTFVIDRDRTAESRLLLDVFGATEYFDVVGSSDRAADLVARLDAGDVTIGLEIPAGFAKDLRRGTTARIQLVVDGTNSNTGTVAQGYATRLLQDFGLRYVGARQPPVQLDIRAWYNPELESRVYNVPGVIGMLILLMCLLLTALAVVREREIGTLDQLMVSPLTPTELILGKTIPVAIIAVMDLALISGVAILWFDIPFRGSPLTLLPAAFIFIVAALSIGLWMSSISRTQQEAFMSVFMFAMPAIILSGFFYPISSMPTVFQWLTYLNPVRHFLEVVRGVFLKGTGFPELWPQFAALGAMAAAGLVFATAQFRRSIA